MKEIELSKEVRQDLVEAISNFFWQERSERISEFQASTILDFMISQMGPAIYNQAIADAHALMSDRIDDLYGLEKRSR